LGIGEQWNDAFLEKIANTTGGTSFYISDPREIHNLLKQKFNDLVQVHAEGVTLNIRTGSGVRLNYAYRLKPEAIVLPVTSPIRLGNIPKSQRQSFILEFILSPIAPSIQKVLLAEGSITFKIPKIAKYEYRNPLNLIRATSANTQQSPPNKQIIEAMSRLTLYRMQEEARNALTAGKPEDASVRLQNMATRFFANGDPELAKMALKEAKNIQQGLNFSEEGQKRIKYGTQALILPTNQKRVGES
jgi:Ca-activated chloride channel family protein